MLNIYTLLCVFVLCYCSMLNVVVSMVLRLSFLQLKRIAYAVLKYHLTSYNSHCKSIIKLLAPLHLGLSGS